MIITADMIANRFQEVLGKQYKVFVNHAFNQKYTNPIRTPYGEGLDFNHQAFHEDAEYIIAVVSTTPITVVNTPYAISEERYTINFWVPINFLKMDEKGELLETPKFNFYYDIQKLDSNIRDKELRFEYGQKEYKCFLTMSPPTLSSNSVERSGAFARVVYKVEGNISLYDLGVATGNDIKIAFVVNGKESAITHFTGFLLGTPTEASSTIVQGDTKQKADPAVQYQSLSFAIEDYDDGDSSEALKLLESRVWKNIARISPDATISNREKVNVRLYKKEALMLDFWGTLNAQYSTASKAGVGSYQVSIQNDGR